MIPYSDRRWSVAAFFVLSFLVKNIVLKKYSIIIAVTILVTFLESFSVIAQERADSTLLVTDGGNVFVVLDTTRVEAKDTVRVFTSSFVPDPAKATWYALVCPGLGQIYNRSYWKVPVLYGGIVTLGYLIVWNGRMYNDYRNAYHDMMDNDPNTHSYESLVSGYTSSDASWLQSTLKRKRDMYRRYRDMSIFGMAGLYLVSVVDAFVDAHLYDFTVSDDLSLRVEPVIRPYLNGQESMQPAVYGFQCSVTF